MNGGITLPRIHNLLGLGAQYQMEPGSNHSTKESHFPPKGGPAYRGGRRLQRGAGWVGEEGGLRCIRFCNLIQEAEREGSDLSQRFTIALRPFSNVHSVIFNFAHFYLN